MFAELNKRIVVKTTSMWAYVIRSQEKKESFIKLKDL